jgi:hypothetical protein
MNESSQETWVVFTSVVGMDYRDVCSLSKWERMNAGRPHYFILIQGDIASREEAERIARSPDRQSSGWSPVAVSPGRSG